MAVIVLVVTAFGVDRLTHLPVAAPFSGDGWTARNGQELILSGPEKPELLSIETIAGSGFVVEASPALMPDGRLVKKLTWRVARPTSPAGDDKVDLQVTLATPGPAATIRMSRTQTATDPELRLKNAGSALHVEGSVVFGSQRLQPLATLDADGIQTSNGPPATRFDVPPGGNIKLSFAPGADGARRGPSADIGAEDEDGPRLWVKEVAIRDESDPNSRLVACGAPTGTKLWAALLRATSRASDADCRAAHTLAVSQLEINPDTLKAGIIGPAFIWDRDQPTLSRWYQWVSGNPVLGIFAGLILSSLVGWVWKTLGKSEAGGKAPKTVAHDDNRI
jgi:hypothetical protein